MHMSFQKVFYVIASAIGLFAILILAKTVLIPIAFALLLAFILFPIARKIESWGVNETVSAILSILGLFLIIGGAFYIFSNQVFQLSENITDFQRKIFNVFADATLFINKNMKFVPELEKGELLEKFKSWFNESAGSLVSQTFTSAASITFGLLTAIIFTFLIIIYRKGLVRALISFYPPEHRDTAFTMFQSVHKVGQKYIIGMMIVVVIVGILNSIGLWIIGIDNPFLFGFFAAVLALIPYAGTLFGAALPMVYAFISTGSIWMPISIGLLFWFVQTIESNFLTPKIVGGSLKINAITSILSIIVGASVWGIAGMIIFLPFAAMVRVICEEYEELKPVALLMGDQDYHKQNSGGNSGATWLTWIKSRFGK